MEIFCRTSCPELTSRSIYMACFRGTACGVFPLHCVRSVSFALRARKIEKISLPLRGREIKRRKEIKRGKEIKRLLLSSLTRNKRNERNFNQHK